MNTRSAHLSVRRRMRGVTLIELMTVIVIVAILGSIAVNSYRSYLLRTNRTEARMALLRIQTAQEKFFLQNNEYADEDDMVIAPPQGLGVLAETPSGFYAITIEDYSSTTYTAVATAINGQLADKAACRRFSINQDGQRSPDTNSGCWK